MAMQSSGCRNAPMKTYSRRASNKIEESSRAKRAAGEVPRLELPSQVKKIKHSSIKSYFEPIRFSSSPATPTPGLSISSDTFETSSPSPAESTSRIRSPKQSREMHRPRRRLQTKPTLAPICDISERSINEVDESFMDLVGSLEDGSQAIHSEESFNMEDCRNYETFRATSILPAPSPVGVNDYPAVILGREDEHEGSRAEAYAFPRLTPPDRIHTPPASFSNVLSQAVGISNKRMKKLSKRILQQSILDLSLDRFRECRGCGMLFNLTYKHERMLHDKFHYNAVQGKQLKKSKSEASHLDKFVDGINYQLRVLTRNTSAESRNLFTKALDISYNDLGGLQVDESSLWSDIKNPHNPHDPNTVPRYNIYAFFAQMMPVAVLLVERIERGGVYYRGPVTHDQFGPSTSRSDETEAETQEYISNDISYPVYMSVDRIWTHKDHRRKGLATMLVDNARDTFIAGMVISKKRIAFSLPTSLGTTFAESYCEGVFQDAKFLVNLEDANYVIDKDRLRRRLVTKV